MKRDIIVVGASAGGVQALTGLVAALPASLPAALFVTLHVAPNGYSVLPSILARAGARGAGHAVDGEAIVPGRIYVAPPRHHLMIEEGRVRLGDGPVENGHRPAIDVLFRSAAQAYRGRVAGVVLSGALDDGTAGLWAIKRRGGLAVVQDPAEAQHPGMIRSALEHVQVDHVLPVAAIGALLSRLAVEEGAHDAALAVDEVDRRLDQEVSLAAHATVHGDLEEPYGRESHAAGLACPSCGGTLWELRDGSMVRYRCRVGHAYSGSSLMAEQNERLEEALWSACRALEENAALARRLARRAASSQHSIAQSRFEARARSATERAAVLRQLLQSAPDQPEPEDAADRPVGDALSPAPSPEESR